MRERFHRIGLDTAKQTTRHVEESARRAAESGAPPQFLEMLRRRSDPEAQAAEFAARVMAAIAQETDADEIAMCELTGGFVYPAPIRITANTLILPGNNTFIGGLMAGSEVGIHIA